MYEFLLVLAVLVFMSLKYRETFVIKYGNPFNDEDLISFDPNAKGTRLFGITPDTCPANKPELDAGLCYEQCEVGYHGVGPVCWANTKNVGIGKVLKLLSCGQSGYPGWTDIGLLCMKPIETGSFGGFFRSLFSTIFERQIKPKRLTCDGYDEHKDNVASLCYRQCPKDLPQRVPGMPYLCYKGTRGLSYGRGVGEVPPIFAFGE
jgi:hypothetical protein